MQATLTYDRPAMFIGQLDISEMTSLGNSEVVVIRAWIRNLTEDAPLSEKDLFDYLSDRYNSTLDLGGYHLVKQTGLISVFRHNLDPVITIRNS